VSDGSAIDFLFLFLFLLIFPVEKEENE